ncbi:hypothetical protein AGMMS50267_14740 [Spirochaetia bacterium]|nr:hypothetical protein AGMMS50267_14740 [Spirochaetia bacterium]
MRKQTTVQAAQTVAGQSMGRAIIGVMRNPALRKGTVGCVKSIFYHFFFLQYKAALRPGRLPVTAVDHPLDTEIPFTPRWVGIYLDFVAFWIRMLGFLLSRYGRLAFKPVLDFIDTMGKLYGFAAEVYTKNLSTTDRPRYYAQPRFVLIHAVDPHLMCIPSLHVMVVIRTYTKFRAILRGLGEDARMAPQIDELHRGARDITEAILYVKQHSVNCVSAAMYAMTRFEPALFPENEAVDFASLLFTQSGSPEASGAVRDYIIARYRWFLEEARKGGWNGSDAPTPDWNAPLLAFLTNPECITDRLIILPPR